MVHAMRVHTPGGPEVMQYEKIEISAPGEGEILIKQTAIGLNFIDTYHRTGLYPLDLPFIPGTEAAGVIEAIGKNVTNFKTGDRVAYVSRSPGAYAEKRILSANRVVKIPDGVSDETAAAAMVKGMTAEYLLRRTYTVKKGDTIVIHAAAGGVGLIMTQWAKHLGAIIIGTVGDENKARIARENGCDHVVLYGRENIAARVREITNGKGVPVVYDSIGKDTFLSSLDCLKPRGMMVSFGNASGPVPDFPPLLLSQKGSLFFTRPSLWHYISDDAEYAQSCAALFDMIQNGKIKIAINQRYALKDAAQAHRDLEARKTTGSTILIP